MAAVVSIQQQAEQVSNLQMCPSNEMETKTVCSEVKSSTNTAPTVVESSEEFTVSGELTSSSADEEPHTLRLSNMAIVEENSRRDTKVQFSGEIAVIEEKDTAVVPTKSSKKSKKEETEEERLDRILPQDVWWSKDELESIAMNAAYMVKESQQYQEEVICSVLYNKAFLSAANLGKSITEDELEGRLSNVTDHSNTLESWTAVGHSRRGLENMVSEKAVVDAVNSRMVVLELQKELREASSSEGDASSPSLAQHSVFLAKRAQDSSRTSRIMARMMGQADADALAKAESLQQETLSLPEAPGRYAGDHEHHTTSERVGRRSRRGSLLGSVKKAVGNVFRRQSSLQADMRRIRKIQQRHQQEAGPEPAKQEFRRSFVESLDYGEQ